MTWEDFEFYLPAFGSIALAVVGAILTFVIFKIMKDHKQKGPPR